DIAAAVQARIPVAIGAAQAWGVSPQYLHDDEKKALVAQINAGPDQGLNVIKAIAQGAGPAAPKIFKELGSEAPVLSHLGTLSVEGGSSTLIADTFSGMQIKKDGGTLPEPNAETKAAGGAIMGGALAY